MENAEEPLILNSFVECVLVKNNVMSLFDLALYHVISYSSGTTPFIIPGYLGEEGG